MHMAAGDSSYRHVQTENLTARTVPTVTPGNTSRHESVNDKSIVGWTDWKTEADASVIIPIRIDVSGGSDGTYNNVNTVFDAYDPNYVSDLLREGNILYTRNGKSIHELLSQRREVPKAIRSDALSENTITHDSQNSKPKLSTETASELRRENDDLRRRVDHWKNQLKRTQGVPLAREADISALARRLA